MSGSSTVDWRAAGIAAVCAIGIVYGSLYPFDFHGGILPGMAWRSLLDTYSVRTGRGDLIANVMLYAPAALFVAYALPRRRIAAIVLAGATLSLTIEFLQVYDAGRDPAMSDVYANTAGTLLGAISGAALRRRIGRLPLPDLQRALFPGLLLVCWTGYRLYPYAPVIDLHKYWHAVRPLLVSPEMRPLDLYRHTVVWLTLALLVETIVGAKRAGPAFLLLVGALFAGRVLIGDIRLSPAETVGAAAAAAIWFSFFGRMRQRAGVAAALLATAVAAEALEPFRFDAVARPFGWVPFRSFLRGSIGVNASAFFEKCFLYGALIWLTTRAGASRWVATAAACAFVFALRLAQVYLPGRSAEVTDAVMVLIMGGIMTFSESMKSRSW